jgi:hypothetical protein
MIALGTIERSKLKSSRPWPDARKRHAGLAFRAAKSLNGEQRDHGRIIGHNPPPQIRRERKTLSHRKIPERAGDESTLLFGVPEALVNMGQFLK